MRGVDRNPLALDLAKLSLWLETLASRHEFTFLDHVLRCGDSLVGLPNPKIMAVTWGKTAAQHSFVEAIVRDGIRAAADLGRLMRAEAEIAPYRVQEGRHREATVALRRAHLVADAVLESFFAGANARERERNLAEVQQLVLAPSPASWGRLEALRDRLRASPIGIAGFHWELEFDDVFARPNAGFDAIVGNPPFAGKNTIASGHPLAYPDWLKTLHPGAHGNADLSSHFFRRAFSLLRQGGAFGLIATNTIRQGDTRETGLARIVAEGGVITRAVSRHRWEGEAAVVVAQVFVRKGGKATGAAVLDGRPVKRISAYLVEGDLDRSPAELRANADQAFQGSILLGLGFTFDDVNARLGKATSLADLRRLLAQNRDNQMVMKSYVGGDDVANSPTGLSESGRQTCLRTGVVPLDYPGEVAADWPELLEIVERMVRPDRAGQDRVAVRERWWQYCEKRPGLYRRCDRATVMVAVQTSPHLSFTFLQGGAVYDQSLIVFPQATEPLFACLQSRSHETWARFLALTLSDSIRYTPSSLFETFPLPPGYADLSALETAVQAYHDHRAALMVARDQGMTPTYNRFHRAADEADDIAQLRRIHADMDRAVLSAYGWDDLAARAAPVFLDAATEDDHQYQGRLFWPAAFRDEVLARLLRLNAERAAAETRL